ncbi:MAG: hypothetical protein IPK33_00660 [Gemmatimonadetes bacterium]|nr:hypothetical protein [Gemmatimonadota bacterium]
MTLRVVRIPVVLSPVVVQAQRDSIGESSFLGGKVKTMASRIITPQEIDAVRGGARDYIELVQSLIPWVTSCAAWTGASTPAASRRRAMEAA